MYQSSYDPFQQFAAYLGSMFGSLVGQILSALLFLLIAFVFWGLPWERLIAKAGFTGRAYWFLLGLFFVPLPIGVAVQNHYGQSNITELLGGLFAGAMYLGLLILAFCPWNVHRKLRQLKDSNP
uniref:Uncharacterized protein n=1 Tax=Oscillatoriales cyanobacterium SpSt-402 TaxID=2282168 RepID=A0A832H3Z2_9CYAN